MLHLILCIPTVDEIPSEGGNSGASIVVVHVYVSHTVTYVWRTTYEIVMKLGVNVIPT